MKIIRSKEEKVIQGLQIEATALSEMNHRHIVGYHSMSTSAEWVKSDGTSETVAYIVLELVTGGELLEYVIRAE